MRGTLLTRVRCPGAPACGGKPCPHFRWHRYSIDVDCGCEVACSEHGITSDQVCKEMTASKRRGKK